MANFCTPDELQETAFENLRRQILPAGVFSALTVANFRAAVEATRGRIPGLAAQLTDQVGGILKLRQEIQRRCGPAPAAPAKQTRTLSDLSQLSIVTKDAPKPANIWAAELDALLPRRFLATMPFDRLAHLPRYLKALATRMERAKLNPAKDAERVQQLAPFVAALKRLGPHPPKDTGARQRLEEFRWMVEEFKVSIFAQELGTVAPVSPQRLERLLQGLLLD